MPEFSKDCDPADAIFFRPDKSEPIGYLLDLSVASTTVPAELKVAVPTDVTAQVSPGTGIRLTPAVAVLGSISWSLRPNEPIRIFAYAEVAVAQTLAALRRRNLPDPVARVSIVIYDYDPAREAYYPQFRTRGGGGAPDPTVPATPVTGWLGKDGLLVAEDPEDLTPGVRVHAVQFELVPVATAVPQQILIQPSPHETIIKDFGTPD
ncbi:hypothetical protein OHA21_09325 [Actinoplanes sp. NBC_00393]|uniref:hypothetical protein n=1 Tax=Actinoplanes sp. NBC_00393 TaxID=2975953 RepID=UPI002E1B56EE